MEAFDQMKKMKMIGISMFKEIDNGKGQNYNELIMG